MQKLDPAAPFSGDCLRGRLGTEQQRAELSGRPDRESHYWSAASGANAELIAN